MMMTRTTTTVTAVAIEVGRHSSMKRTRRSDWIDEDEEEVDDDVDK